MAAGALRLGGGGGGRRRGLARWTREVETVVMAGSGGAETLGAVGGSSSSSFRQWRGVSVRRGRAESEGVRGQRGSVLRGLRPKERWLWPGIRPGAGGGAGRGFGRRRRGADRRWTPRVREGEEEKASDRVEERVYRPGESGMWVRGGGGVDGPRTGCAERGNEWDPRFAREKGTKAQHQMQETSDRKIQIKKDPPCIRLSLEGASLEETAHVSAGNGQVDSHAVGVNHPGASGSVGGDNINDETDEAVEVWSAPPVPYTGMSFATTDEARFFYNEYAKRIGFSVRTDTSRLSAVSREKHKVQLAWKGEEEEARYKDYENKPEPEAKPENGGEGGVKTKKLDGGKKRKREKMKYTNCKARMAVKLIGKRWQVIYFIPEHNHDLVLKPSLKKFLRSHKGIPKEEKQFFELLHGCNLATGRIMQVMNEFYGSAQVVPYEAKDISNFRSSIRKVEKYRDMAETLEYFQGIQKEDPDFFYKIKLDSEHKVKSIFWVDSPARNVYIESYHDCISFDATYMTNMYDMPFTPFIGINKHGQSFQVGCAFIRDEKIASYKWLFSTFLEAMRSKAPLNIITDQDAAMRSAIL
ncbi:hypothetical protein U9M48_026661 [Paspalum notatum var. saurae]|uniref:Protein FAR1-RELATED SEQUENCE n=1 Tax=Paspalum notatum var. saurae TaxID=547442 RepID=A0AAQ3WYJ4_PASNO